MELPLHELVLDYNYYPRVEVSEEHVQRMLETLLAGGSLPPVVVCAATKRIVDGFHRYHAYKKAGRKTIPAELRSYADEAGFYRDAVAANISHGRPLSRFELKRIAVRCEELGISREEAAELLRVRPETLDGMRREIAYTGAGAVPTKRGLESLQGQKLTPQQERTLKNWGGMNVVFYANRLLDYLEAGLPVTAPLAERLDRIASLWETRKRGVA